MSSSRPKTKFHLRIKQLVTGIKSAVTAIERGQKEFRTRAENPLKRKQEDSKKQRSDNECVSEQNDGSEWRTVKIQKEKHARKE